MKYMTRRESQRHQLSSPALQAFLVLLVSLSFVPRVSAETFEQVSALRALEKRIKSVVADCKPAFVFIKGDQGAGYSSGSGFCISPDGYVLTNDHVIAGARSVVAYMTGGRYFKTVVVGRDPGGDVALLKLEGKGKFPFVKLGDSQAVRPGQRVLALGDPFLTGSENVFVPGAPANFEPAVSMGIVSAVHRYSETYNDAIQVDLAVNRGNSGGPLITLDGKVVGINGKIETRFALGINTGVGYAVPSNQISRFMKHLRRRRGELFCMEKSRVSRLASEPMRRPACPWSAFARVALPRSPVSRRVICSNVLAGCRSGPARGTWASSEPIPPVTRSPPRSYAKERSSL